MTLTDIDRNLLNRCLTDEPSAWKDFVDRFVGLFVHVIQHTAQARSVRINQQDIDDLCADVFLAILDDDFAILRNFRGNSSLATYLTVIARRVVVKELAKRRRIAASGSVASRREPTESQMVERVQNVEEVQRLLQSLPSTDAEIVRQYHLEGRTYREISAQLGIPENSIGPTLSRARDKMRESRSRI